MLSPSITEELKRITGANGTLTAKEDMVAYSYDATSMWTHLPDAVVLPHDSQQISKILIVI